MPQKQCSKLEMLTTSIEELEELILKTALTSVQNLVQKALSRELELHLQENKNLLDEKGKQQVVKNGQAPERTILTGVGPITISRPRIDDRKAVKNNPDYNRFVSGVLPPFLRRTPSVEGTIAVLYLKGISGNDFDAALEAIYGESAGGLSASTVSRLKEVWYEEYGQWRKTKLASKEYAYIWADGVYFNTRVEGERNCILVVVGAKYNGEKELLALSDGVRESEESWKELLLELKGRGMEVDPKLATADGALGFWKALPQVFPTTKAQRCWVHKLVNILDKLPKKLHPRAKMLLTDIYMAETKKAADKAFDHFCESYRDKYPKAVQCLEKDRGPLLAFYEFPAAHWKHIRSTNVIESVFATVRLRTYKTKGLGTRNATIAMTFKLIKEAEKRWNKLTKANQLELVREGRVFKDGELIEESAA